ncbi:MAG: hypothetical protein JO254_10285 [Pseudolabrys sp.]|nr:hypothetical protein [Pseudolabrys sp.]
MKIIAIYVALVAAGDLIAYAVGRAVESAWPTASLPVFLGLFFFVFWAGWKTAVRLT